MTESSRPLLVAMGPGLDGIEQVLASARKRGVDAAWIGLPFSRGSRARARLFCDHVGTAGTATEIGALLEAWGPQRIIDILCVDDLIALCWDGVRPLLARGLPPAVAEDLERRVRLSNKRATQDLLSAHGVGVPERVDATEVRAVQAAERLGLPLVVKGYVGSGGSAVRITRDVVEAQRVADVLVRRGGAYFERHLDGVQSSYVATHRDGRVIQEGSYRSVKSARNPLGFSGQVLPESRPELLDFGRRLTAVIGGRGIVNVNVITTPDDALWAIDVNPRPWHSTVALRLAGIDFVSGYLHAIGAGADPGEPSRLPAGPPVTGYPREAAELVLEHPLRALRMFVRQSRTWYGWTGAGFVVASVIRAARTLAGRVYRSTMLHGPLAVTRVLPRLGSFGTELGPVPTAEPPA